MKPADSGGEEGLSVLKSILQLTQTLRKKTAANDLDAVAALLERRRGLLELASGVIRNQRDEPVRAEMERQLVGILKAIRHEDEALLDMLSAKKLEVLGNLRACNNQRLLQAYSR